MQYDDKEKKEGQYEEKIMQVCVEVVCKYV